MACFRRTATSGPNEWAAIRRLCSVPRSQPAGVLLFLLPCGSVRGCTRRDARANGPDREQAGLDAYIAEFGRLELTQERYSEIDNPWLVARLLFQEHNQHAAPGEGWGAGAGYQPFAQAVALARRGTPDDRMVGIDGKPAGTPWPEARYRPRQVAEHPEQHADEFPAPAGLPRAYLRHCLLLLLAEGRSHGYDLLEAVRALGLRSADAGGLYRTLRALDEDGHVRSWWEPSGSGPARRTYEITDEGRVALDALIAEVHDVTALLEVLVARHRAPVNGSAR